MRRAHLEGDERGISAGLVIERDGLDAVQAWLDRVRPADFGDRPPR